MRFLLLVLLVATSSSLHAGEGKQPLRSHPPLRTPPPLSKRPLPEEKMYFVAAQDGDDANAGSRTSPWKTVGHAVRRLHAGDTLVLRAGTYHENVRIALAGRKDAPITLRGFPGEEVILDGGL